MCTRPSGQGFGLQSRHRARRGFVGCSEQIAAEYFVLQCTTVRKKLSAGLETVNPWLQETPNSSTTRQGLRPVKTDRGTEPHEQLKMLLQILGGWRREWKRTLK